MPALPDLELLGIEMDLLWGSGGGPELVIACARDGLRARVSNSVPADVARTLIVEVAAQQPGTGLGAPPHDLERWSALLTDALGVSVTLAPGSGPSYLVHDSVAFQPTAPLVRSDDADVGALRNANPGNWGADEWLDLLGGRLGPWVMAMQGDRVISICHTPVFDAHAAEAGTWTDPDFRGRGHAAATTAEWAALMRPSGRLLFYSTSHVNGSSQRVAARLGLRSVGWLWQRRRMHGHSGWTDPRVAGGSSSIEGSGLYAAAPIHAGEVVFVWGGGRVISNAERQAIAASGKRYSSAAVAEDQNLLWDVVDTDAGDPGGASDVRPHPVLRVRGGLRVLWRLVLQGREPLLPIQGAFCVNLLSCCFGRRDQAINGIAIVSGLGLLSTIAWWLRGPYQSSVFVGLGMLGAVITWSACTGWLPDWTASPGLVLMTGCGCSPSHRPASSCLAVDAPWVSCARNCRPCRTPSPDVDCD